MSYLIFSLFLLPFVSSDVLRTVYCKNQCNDYLKVPDDVMPTCTSEHLKMNECGTVITCDWSEAERDKSRSVANNTNIICCYHTTIKEKGDCDPRYSEVHMIESSAASDNNVVRTSCSEAYLSSGWPWAILLLFVVFLETCYILWTCVHGPSHQKIVQAPTHSTHPIVYARPLVTTNLLTSNHCEA